MEKYYWDVLTKTVEVSPYQAEVILDEVSTILDYSVDSHEQALQNMKEVEELKFLFDESLTHQEKTDIIVKIDCGDYNV